MDEHYQVVFKHKVYIHHRKQVWILAREKQLIHVEVHLNILIFRNISTSCMWYCFLLATRIAITYELYIYVTGKTI